MFAAPSSPQKTLLLIASGLLVVLGIFMVVRTRYYSSTPAQTISSFEECAAAGYPIMESYPEQCRTPEGQTFVRQIVVENQQVTLSGEVVCLPHKDQTGPQTLECAFGLKADDGNHYGLSDPEMKYIMQLPTGQRTTVTGTLKNNQNNPTNKYDTVGVIEISSLSTSSETSVVEYTCAAGMTAYTALEASFEVEFNQTSLGKLVTSINGVSQDGGKYWIYSIDGKEAEVGSESYNCKGTETITWELK